MMDFRPHRYTSACGRLDLFARDYAGEGPALLLMHGLTRNSADFEPLIEHLAGRYHLIVPDQRGRGLSEYDPDPANYRPDVYARDMFALLDDLGVDSADLIGTSMGGLMAMVMAAQKPDRVLAAVLNDVGPELDPAGLGRISGYVGASEPFADIEAAADRCAAINAEAFPGFDREDWLAFAHRTTRQRGDGRVEFAYDPAIAVPFTDPGEVSGSADLWPLWAALDGKPVLILRGDRSDLLSPATAERMRREHAGPVAYAEIAERGHAPLLDEPDALAAIDRFLAEFVA